MRVMRAGLFGASLALLVAPVGGDVRAAPLDAQGCARLKEEQGQLEQSGVRASMAKGPEWAKGNLPPDKLEQIKRLIDVDAQLVFRCHGKPLVQLPPEIEADPAAVKDGGTAAKPGPAAPAPQKQEKKKRPAKAVKKASAPADGPSAAAPVAAPKKAAPAAKAAAPASSPQAPPGQPAAAKAAQPKAKQKAKASGIDPPQPPPNP